METNDFGIHPKFTLNGISYTQEELKAEAYHLVKKGSAFENSIGNFLSDWLDEKPSIEVQTSGSTGTPKNIFLKKQQMVNSAMATGKYFDLREESTALLCLPVDYIAGKMMLVRAMVLGLKLDYVAPSSKPLNEISKTVDFAAMVPLQLENSIDEIERIKTLIVGGAAVSRLLKEKVHSKSTAVFETYGMTETITHVAIRNIKLSIIEGQTGKGFKALPDVSFSKDERECLVISAPKVSDDSVITNDIVNLISETEFEWLGRFDNVINSGGIKLFPEQIEKKLAELLINRFFVAGLPDENLGQRLVLVVEGELDANKLLQTLKEDDNFEGFEIPKSIHKLPKFLETDTGKIRRKENLNLI